jgi:succinate-semialdehyde dehydrogenase/glutarate-semialdehyde dehydrogenase
MDDLKVGDPIRDETEIGPLANEAQVNELDAQVQAAMKAGARVLTGGARMVGKGNYYEPTVLADVPRECEVYRQELFGPVAMLFRVHDMGDAIRVANDTPFGLAASVWTCSEAEQRHFAEALECGAIFFNEIVASDPRLPFGGVKRSGYGRELSAAGMREFLNAKTVVVAQLAESPAPSSEDAAASQVEDPDEDAVRSFRDELLATVRTAQ